MILGVIQARMGSTRLPGKALKPLGKRGMPSLWYIYKRMKNSGLIDKVIIATTPSAKDGPIRAFCKTMNIMYLAGDEHNLMKRMTQVIHAFKPELIVDVTGDCPLVDPKHIATCIRKIKQHSDIDHCSNIFYRSWPDGFDVQVYKASSFLKLSEMKVIDPEGFIPKPGPEHPAWNKGIVTEHTGWNFLNNNHSFNFYAIEGPKETKHYHPTWKLTMDTQRDFNAIDAVLKGMARDIDRSNFNSAEKIIDFILDNPDIKNMIRIEDEPWET